ncbi:cytochrome d ubiquinol oxidase subunit II [Singulisphaera sp. PoT]|uniref:cytochrome d ubiquinol oxidase subunit II n=1 Tax=Singulisphaera sp. PoT TaxID=3411797 RepID=UPI003BF4C6A1
MEATWFAIVSAMLAGYAVLDGFDFGVGILHRIVAKTADERKTILAAIGPVWDGNEVWLIAAGGLLFMAFPKVYATGFSGFYMALMILLWLLILRGIAIEFRSHQENPLWREFWDTVFSLASLACALIFGVALGNLIRGVPIDEKGLRGMPLFTNFRTDRHLGLIDWYTGLVGVFALVSLAGHGALYLAWRTTGPVRDRCLALARDVWMAAMILWVVVTAATAWIRPEVFYGFLKRPWTLAFVVLAIAGAVGAFRFPKRGRELAAFLSSSVFIFGMVATAMAGNYPYWLRSTIDPEAFSLTAANSMSARYGMSVALGWWSVGFILVLGYFAYLFSAIRGKVVAGDGPYSSDAGPADANPVPPSRQGT